MRRRRLILLALLGACADSSDLPDTSPCLAGGNLLITNGEPVTGNATARLAPDGGAAVTFPVPAQGTSFSLTFLPARAGAYESGFSISAPGHPCVPAGGRFVITEIVLDHMVISRLTAAFEQDCDGGDALRGCVHVGL